MKREGPTTQPDLRCTGCGARRVDAAGACAYCGSTVEAPPAPAPQEEPDPAEVRRARLRELRESPRFGALAQWAPSGGAVVAGFVLMIVVGSVFAGMAIFIGSRGHADGPFKAISTLFVLLGIGIAVAGVARWMVFASAPLRVFAAYAVSKRTEHTGGNDSSTRYFVTLEDERGSRREHRATGSVYGLVAEEDLGVAYVRDGHLLAFRTR